MAPYIHTPPLTTHHISISMRTLRYLQETTPSAESKTLTDLQCKALIASFLVLIIVVAYCLIWFLCRRYGRSAGDCPSTGGICRKRSSAYRRVLETLPVVVYSHNPPSSSSLEEADCCAICLAEYGDGDAVRVLPICKHFLHVECLDQWLLRSLKCPICRAPVIDDAEIDDRDRTINEEEDHHHHRIHVNNFYNPPMARQVL